MRFGVSSECFFKIRPFFCRDFKCQSVHVETFFDKIMLSALFLETLINWRANHLKDLAMPPFSTHQISQPNKSGRYGQLETHELFAI